MPFLLSLRMREALTRAEIVLRAAMKRILRLDLSLRNQFLRRSGMVKTVCLCLVSRQKETALAESCLAYLYAAGITETRMAVSVAGGKVITMRVLTLKIIAAEINGIAEDRTLDIIKDARAGTTGSIPAFYDVIIMKEDRSDGIVNIKIDKIKVMRILKFKNDRVNRSIDHE